MATEHENVAIVLCRNEHLTMAAQVNASCMGTFYPDFDLVANNPTDKLQAGICCWQKSDVTWSNGLCNGRPFMMRYGYV